MPTIHVLVLSAAEIHVPAGPVHRPRRTAGPDRGGGADAAAHRRHRAVTAGEAIGGHAAQVNDRPPFVQFLHDLGHTHTPHHQLLNKIKANRDEFKCGRLHAGGCHLHP